MAGLVGLSLSTPFLEGGAEGIDGYSQSRIIPFRVSLHHSLPRCPEGCVLGTEAGDFGGGYGCNVKSSAIVATRTRITATLASPIVVIYCPVLQGLFCA
jgi:hypothetical protein